MKINKEKKENSERNPKAKQSENKSNKNEKVGAQWVKLCYYICFASKVVSFVSNETPKLAVSLFRETSETSLFVFR